MHSSVRLLRQPAPECGVRPGDLFNGESQWIAFLLWFISVLALVPCVVDPRLTPDKPGSWCNTFGDVYKGAQNRRHFLHCASKAQCLSSLSSNMEIWRLLLCVVSLNNQAVSLDPSSDAPFGLRVWHLLFYSWLSPLALSLTSISSSGLMYFWVPSWCTLQPHLWFTCRFSKKMPFCPSIPDSEIWSSGLQAGQWKTFFFNHIGMKWYSPKERSCLLMKALRKIPLGRGPGGVNSICPALVPCPGMYQRPLPTVAFSCLVLPPIHDYSGDRFLGFFLQQTPYLIERVNGEDQGIP